jgi:hypothetical protein
VKVTFKPQTAVDAAQCVLSLPEHGLCLPGPHVALCVNQGDECACGCDEYGGRCWRRPAFPAEIEGVGPVVCEAIVERSEIRWRDFTAMHADFEGERTWSFKRHFTTVGVVGHFDVDLAQREFLIPGERWVLIFDRSAA